MTTHGTGPIDPLDAVVNAILVVDPGFGEASIRAVAEAVSGGRAKQRRLAQALISRPGVLRDGRSPAPLVVGQLLIALRTAGATRLAAPRCAECDTEVTALSRRGQDWLCRTCNRRRAPCTDCGQHRNIYSRDTQGRPRCQRCTPRVDPQACLHELTAVITGVDPSVATEAIATAVRAAARQPSQLRQLTIAVTDHPRLLTGDGATAPTPAVLRLIDALCEAGATQVRRPACPTCTRTVRLVERCNGVWVCRGCRDRSRAESCSRCGASRTPSTRDEQGRPVCSYCFALDPANLQSCTRCHRPRRVYAHTSDGPICQTCRTPPAETCEMCGHLGTCETSRVTGQRRCRACQARRRRCAGCGHVKPVQGGTADRPLCNTCTQSTPGFWRACPACGLPNTLTRDRCTRCALQDELHRLLAAGPGATPPQLQLLVDYLQSGDRPDSARTWLRRQPHARALLADLGSGALPLTHEALDGLPHHKCVEHLRGILVAAGALPVRDEYLVRLESWLAATITAKQNPASRQLMRRYAQWHHLRRLRARAGAAGITYAQMQRLRHHTTTAISFLDMLATDGLDLSTCDQGTLDQMLADRTVGDPNVLGTFIRWAKAHKLTALDLPARRWHGPQGPIDEDRRWTTARHLLHDDRLPVADRVAGLLLLLYAQTIGDISRLTLDQVTTDGERTSIRFGVRPIDLPEPLATLVRLLTGARAVARSAGSAWLFPGRPPTGPITPASLLKRLAGVGIQAKPARSAALLQLAAELPASVLARSLGISVKTAVKWQHASSGDWVAYAADIGQRHPSHKPPTGSQT